MASSGERRLLFDTRGKRKHVIRVVYAILALLMGASLFLVTGSVNLGALLGNSNSGGGSAAKVFDEQVERVEGRLAKNPEDAQLLLTLTRAQISAGNARLEGGSETEKPTVTPEAKANYEAAWESWNRYLKQAAGEPSPTAAQLVAGTFFKLAESSTSLLEAEEFVAEATKAQQVAAEQSPSLGSLSSLAIFQYFNSELAGGDETAKKAAAKAPEGQGKEVEKQLAEIRKNAEEFDKKKSQLSKVQKEFNKEQLKNPLGGFSSEAGGSLGG